MFYYFKRGFSKGTSFLFSILFFSKKVKQKELEIVLRKNKNYKLSAINFPDITVFVISTDPERSRRGVERSSQFGGAVQNFSAKIPRLPLVARDDRVGGGMGCGGTIVGCLGWENKRMGDRGY